MRPRTTPTQRGSRARIAVVFGSFVLAFAATFMLGAAASGATTPAPDCVPVRVITCALPFPSDHWEQADATSPTGVRARVPDGIMSPAFLAQVPASLQPRELFRGATGYSAAGPVLFEFDGPVLPTTFGADGHDTDGRDTVIVFDRVTGEQVPVWTEVDIQAFGNLSRSHVIRIWPKSRFAFGHRHTAVVTTGVRRLGGAAFAPAPGVPAAATADAAFLRTKGIEPVHVLSITSWMVRDEGNATQPLIDAVNRTYAADHPVEITGALPGLFPNAGALLRGRVRTSDMRTTSDGGFNADPNVPPRDQWVNFWLLIPWSAGGTPSPVAVYEHGLTTTKETFVFVAIQNAQHGIATIAMDQPNHGDRGDTEGFLKFMPSPGNVARLAAIPAQSVVDHASLIKALRTSLRHVDALPWSYSPILPPPGVRPGFGGDGVADLDPDRLIIQGTSLGSVLGSTAIAVIPGVDGGVLTVGGAGIMHTLTSSLIWDTLEFWRSIPIGGSGGEAALAVAAVQQRMDVGDPVNYAHLWRTPPDGGPPRRVALVTSAGDGIVRPATADALAIIGGLGQLEPIQHRVAGLPVTTESSGSMYLQMPDDAPPLVFGVVRGWLNHVSFLRPEAQNLSDGWLTRWMSGDFADE